MEIFERVVVNNPKLKTNGQAGYIAWISDIRDLVHVKLDNGSHIIIKKGSLKTEAETQIKPKPKKKCEWDYNPGDAGSTKKMSAVKKPSHYQLLPDYEVKDVIKALLDKVDESDFEISSNDCGWLQQALQYQFRFYAKGGWEDLEKAYEALGFVLKK